MTSENMPAHPLTTADRLFRFGDDLISRLTFAGLEPVLGRLDRGLREGALNIRTPEGHLRRLGGHAPGPEAHIHVHHWRLLRRLLAGGTVGLARSYFDHDWDSSDVATIIELFARNRATISATLRGGGWTRAINALLHRGRANSVAGSRRNIAFHYDLGNDFYAAWLDPGMTYSAALFTQPDATLEQAQTAKIKHLLDSIRLRPGETLLEIGCGWGSLAEIAARDYGARVTGITLSQEQLAYANARMARLGLSERVTLRLEDYRHTQGTFDKIASVEMLEAVGERYWPDYMTTLHNRLRPGGQAGLQVITIDPTLFDAYRRGADFIQTYIFPGGLLPTQAHLQAHSAKAGLIWHTHRSFGQDYARTLALWHQAFNSAVVEKRLPPAMNDAFVRLWQFYLSYCEGGFRGGSINVCQASVLRP